MSSPLAETGSGAWIGIGIGLGIFSSIFATVGIFLCSYSWISMIKANQCKVGYLPFIMFITVFSSPFIAVPALIGLVFVKIWLITVIGYSIPVLYIACFCPKSTLNNKPKLNKRIKMNINMSPKEKASNLASMFDNTSLSPNNNNNNNKTYNTTENKRNFTEVWMFLKEIGLLEYYDLLISNGYENKSDLMTLTESDLNSIGISKHLHRKKLLNGLNNTNNSYNDKNDFYDNYNNINQSRGEGALPKYSAPSAPNDDDDDDLPPAYTYGN